MALFASLRASFSSSVCTSCGTLVAALHNRCPSCMDFYRRDENQIVLNENMETVLHIAASKYPESLPKLIHAFLHMHHLSLNSVDVNGNTFLHVLANRDDCCRYISHCFDYVQYLNLNIINADGKTPFLISIEKGCFNCMDCFKGRGAVLFSDYEVMRNTLCNNAAAARTILTHRDWLGFDLSLVPYDDLPLLHIIVAKYDVSMLRFLPYEYVQEHLNAKDKDGKTPLHILMCSSRDRKMEDIVDTARYLLDCGADMTEEDDFENKPIDYARDDELREVMGKTRERKHSRTCWV